MATTGDVRMKAQYIFCLIILLLAGTVMAKEGVATGFLVPSKNPYRTGYLRDVSMQEAVEEFNQRRKADSIGKRQPPLTCEELRAVVKKKSFWPNYSKSAKKILRRIAQIEVLPRGSYLNDSFCTSGCEHASKRREMYEIYLMWGLEINPLDDPNVWYKPYDEYDVVMAVRKQWVE